MGPSNDMMTSRLLEDKCMQTLNWNIQRVANATVKEMEEALQISKSLQISKAVELSESLQRPKAISNRTSRIPSRKQSRRSSPKHELSPIQIPNQIVEIERQNVPVVHIHDESNNLLNNITLRTTQLKNIQQRIQKQNNILNTQHITQEDRRFLKCEIKKDETFFKETSDTLTMLLTDHIKSKRILLNMYNDLSAINENIMEYNEHDHNMIKQLTDTITSMENIITDMGQY
jgi:hypothetical protein